MIIDLNSDLGESFGVYNLGLDSELLKYVSSVNIACGFHAGDPMVMSKTVEMALENKVNIGAHPGFPDLLGFGRRNMQISEDEVKNYILYQVGALKAFIDSQGGRLNHVKPHGALYNMAAKDYNLSLSIAKAIKLLDPELIFYGLSNSQMQNASNDINLKFKSEVFADRSYSDDGLLVSRDNPGAFIIGADNCAERIGKMIKFGEVLSINNKIVNIKADTVCVHGDNKESLLFVKALKFKLESLGLTIC